MIPSFIQSSTNPPKPLKKIFDPAITQETRANSPPTEANTTRRTSVQIEPNTHFENNNSNRPVDSKDAFKKAYQENAKKPELENFKTEKIQPSTLKITTEPVLNNLQTNKPVIKVSKCATGTGVGALLYSYLNPQKSEINIVNQFNVNSPRMANVRQNTNFDQTTLPNDEKTQKMNTVPNLKFLDSSAFSAFSKDKLKNLEDALSKHYTTEQLNQLGIIVNKTSTPQVTSPKSTKSSDTSDRADSRFYSPHFNSDKSELNKLPKLNQDQNQPEYNNYRNQYVYPQGSSTYSFRNQPSLSNQQQLFASPAFKYPSPGSHSSYSPASSITGYTYPPYNKTKEANSSQNETAMLNAVAAAAAAVNKNSPQLFSKYIESVHKAMHGGNVQDAVANDGSSSSTLGDF